VRPDYSYAARFWEKGLDEFLDYRFLKPAVHGDWNELADYLEGRVLVKRTRVGGRAGILEDRKGPRNSEHADTITPRMLEFIVGVLRGKIKRPPIGLQRPQQYTTTKRLHRKCAN
jgi:hypothetical protein